MKCDKLEAENLQIIKLRKDKSKSTKEEFKIIHIKAGWKTLLYGKYFEDEYNGRVRLKVSTAKL